MRPLGALIGTGTCSNAQCNPSEIAPGTGSLSFNQTLSYDTHYMTVKGRKANEKGFYEVQIGDPATQASSISSYVPPTWTPSCWTRWNTTRALANNSTDPISDTQR